MIIGILSGLEVIGDGLIKLPFLQALRIAWPDAEIHWITTKGATVYAGALEEITKPFLNHVHECPDWLESQHASKAPSFDLLIDTRGRWKLALQAKRRLKHKLFIAPAWRYAFSDKRPPLLSPRPQHILDRLLQMVELAAGYQPNITGHLPIAKDLKTKARRILPEGFFYVGFAPGAGNTIKMWPLERFIKLAQMQARMGHIPVFILGPDEITMYDQIFREVPEALFPLQATIWDTTERSITHTIAVASCLDIALTNDSGTSHMLEAANCPLISLFGPTRASKLAPKVSQGKTVCSQQFKSDSMADIPIEYVSDTLNREILLLKQP